MDSADSESGFARTDRDPLAPLGRRLETGHYNDANILPQHLLDRRATNGPHSGDVGVNCVKGSRVLLIVFQSVMRA